MNKLIFEKVRRALILSNLFSDDYEPWLKSATNDLIKALHRQGIKLTLKRKKKR
jgi:hypothetical protein